MSPINRLQPVFVEAIPRSCGQVTCISQALPHGSSSVLLRLWSEVVTPLNPAKWRLTERGDMVSLYPSIGNWAFLPPHYWIENNRVRWSWAMSKAETARVRKRDQRDVEWYANARHDLLQRRGLFRRNRREPIGAFMVAPLAG